MFGRKKRKGEEAVELALPITPMLDMTFQLLAFFVMTFKPPINEGQIPMRLPAVDPPPNAQPTPDEQLLPEDKEDEYIIVVSPGRDGAAGDLTLKTTTAATSFPSTMEKRLEALQVKLKELYENQKATKKGATIKIEVFPDMVYSQLVNIMNVCRQAGFNSIGISEPKKEKT
jgi:biopolymer transport protein ExbD